MKHKPGGKSSMKSTPAGGAGKRVLIVDDHPMTRRGLVALIDSEPDLSVCGEAGNAREALEAAKNLNADLALVDITLPGQSGLALIKDFRLWVPELYILVLSMHDEDLYAERVLRAGGHGYIMKSEGGAELLQAIRHVLGGATYLSQKVSGKIVNAYVGRGKKMGDAAVGQLSEREFEVFQLMGQGLPTTEMGRRLHLSPKTVDTHRLHIKEKLRVKSVPELVRYAVRWTTSEEILENVG
jgi:DNA-binding NarL/FixJ family response regulator